MLVNMCVSLHGESVGMFPNYRHYSNIMVDPI